MPISLEVWHNIRSASQEGDQDRLNSIFTDGAIDVNDTITMFDMPPERFSMTLLCQAIAVNDEVLVRFLLENNVDVTRTGLLLGRPHAVPLHLALNPGISVGILRDLLNHNASLFSTSISGEWALNAALRQGVRHKLEIILRTGAENEAYEDHKTYFQLCLAIIENRLDEVNSLLDSIPDVNFPDFKGENPLFCAIYRNSLELVELLLAKGANVAKVEELGRESALKYAVGTGASLDIIRRILAAPGIDMNCSYNRHNNIFQDIQAERIILIDQLPRHILETILSQSPLDSVQDKDEETALHFAARLGQLDCVRLFLQRGMDINCDISGSKETPLHTSTGHPEVTQFLLIHGALPNARDKFGKTPLHRCAEFGHIAAFRLIFQFGGDISLLDNTGRTILHHAVETRTGGIEGTEQIARFVLEPDRLDVNCKTLRGETPLCISNKIFCNKISLLLNKGADFRETSVRPEDIAQIHPHGCSVSGYFKKLLQLGFYLDPATVEQLPPNYFAEDEGDITRFRQEIDALKAVELTPEKSLYRLLVFNDVVGMNRSTNHRLAEIYEEIGENFENRFPEYGFLLNRHYRRVLEKKDIVPSAQALLDFYIAAHVPAVCSRIIFRYFSKNELLTMITDTDD